MQKNYNTVYYILFLIFCRYNCDSIINLREQLVIKDFLKEKNFHIMRDNINILYFDNYLTEYLYWMFF